MSIIKQYFDYQLKYESIYGKDKTLVLIQIGSFYEAYATEQSGYNLKEISELLNIVYTQKDKSIKEISLKNPIMVGVPTVAINKYLKILVDDGYTIIIIDQVTPPPNPERKVTGIYSSGTYIEEQNIPDSNNIVSVYIEDEKQMDGSYLYAIGLSSIDLTTGHNYVHESYSKSDDDKLSLDDACKFIKMYMPKEIIITVSSDKDKEQDKEQIKNKLLTYLDIGNNKYIYNNDVKKCFKKISYQNNFLLKIFPDNGMLTVLEYIDMEKKPYAVISYMILLDFAYNHNENIIKNINKPIAFENDKHLILENNAILQLNILKTDSLETRNKKYQCLFDVVNNTSTALGRRLLKDTLVNPLTSKNILEKRYNLIEYLIKDNLYIKVEDFLKGISDIERLQRKLSLKMLHPSEFYNLHTSYINILKIIGLLKDKKEIIPSSYEQNLFSNLINEYSKIFNLEEINKYHINDITGSFFMEGYCTEIDEMQIEIMDCLSFMENFRLTLEKFMGNKKDKDTIHIQNNDRDGYYLNLTGLRADVLQKELSKVKHIMVGENKIKISDIIFKKLVKGNTKIFLQMMNEKSEKIVILKDKMRNIVKNEYINVLEILYEKYKKTFQTITSFIEELDFLKSGAKTAVLYNYCKPIINKKVKGCVDKDKGYLGQPEGYLGQPEGYLKSYIKAKNMRHPIVERIQQDTEYIPNDITLGYNNNDGMLLYGLNSSGKTVLMKAVGISIILAQSGLYVPCKEFEYNPYNLLFARITGNDNLFKGLSSFALEMVELRAILKRSTMNTLIIGDEICRGTEQTSGNSIVASTIIHLSNKKSSFIFASHLHDIPKMKRIIELNNVKSYHLKVDYDEKTNNLIFNRKLNEGSGPDVYGLTVAKYLIKDLDFIQLAEHIKKEIVNEPEILIADKQSVYNKDVYMNNCKICLSYDDLDTHHINFQKDCENGFVKKKEYIKKNAECNLVVLCKDCHKQVHNGTLMIYGYENTSNGRNLKYEYVELDNDKIVEILNKYKNMNKNINAKKAKYKLIEDYGIKISKSKINMIWNNTIENIN
jgi:DNA mismatch repair protein MutS